MTSGAGGFGLDISRRRPALLALRRLPLHAEAYHAFLDFDLPVPLALGLEESAAEKISALARRMEHGSAKDVYDLSLYLPRPQRQPLLRRLIALTFWSDSRLVGDPHDFVSQIVPAAFRWEELGGLLPRRKLDPDAIGNIVRSELGHLFEDMTTDELTLIDDAASHREVALFNRLAEGVGALDGD